MDRFRFNEGSVGAVWGTLLNAEGETFPPSTSVNLVTVSLVDVESFDPTVSPIRGVINGLFNAPVTDRIEIDTDFNFTFTFLPEENIVVNSRRQLERHRAIFVFEGTVVTPGLRAKPPMPPNANFASGAVTVECEIEVVNLATVN